MSSRFSELSSAFGGTESSGYWYSLLQKHYFFLSEQRKTNSIWEHWCWWDRLPKRDHWLSLNIKRRKELLRGWSVKAIVSHYGLVDDEVFMATNSNAFRADFLPFFPSKTHVFFEFIDLKMKRFFPIWPPGAQQSNKSDLGIPNPFGGWCCNWPKCRMPFEKWVASFHFWVLFRYCYTIPRSSSYSWLSRRVVNLVPLANCFAPLSFTQWGFVAKTSNGVEQTLHKLSKAFFVCPELFVYISKEAKKRVPLQNSALYVRF